MNISACILITDLNLVRETNHRKHPDVKLTHRPKRALRLNALISEF